MSYPLTAIIADLHGNRPALESALADAKERGARRFVCLGDVVGYGSHPRHNLEWVMRICVPEPDGSRLGFAPGELEPGLCLQGNHEYALLNSAEDFNPKREGGDRVDARRAQRLARPRARPTTYWDYLGSLEAGLSDDERGHVRPRLAA